MNNGDIRHKDCAGGLWLCVQVVNRSVFLLKAEKVMDQGQMDCEVSRCAVCSRVRWLMSPRWKEGRVVQFYCDCLADWLCFCQNLFQNESEIIPLSSYIGNSCFKYCLDAAWFGRFAHLKRNGLTVIRFTSLRDINILNLLPERFGTFWQNPY